MHFIVIGLLSAIFYAWGHKNGLEGWPVRFGFYAIAILSCFTWMLSFVLSTIF